MAGPGSGQEQGAQGRHSPALAELEVWAGGMGGWGQPLDVQKDWDPRASIRRWELEARGPGIRKALS